MQSLTDLLKGVNSHTFGVQNLVDKVNHTICGHDVSFWDFDRIDLGSAVCLRTETNKQSKDLKMRFHI